MNAMPDQERSADASVVTNGCDCGWSSTGPIEEVVAATIDHGSRVHNMAATREQVLAALGVADPAQESSRAR